MPVDSLEAAGRRGLRASFSVQLEGQISRKGATRQAAIPHPQLQLPLALNTASVVPPGSAF